MDEDEDLPTEAEIPFTELYQLTVSAQTLLLLHATLVHGIASVAGDIAVVILSDSIIRQSIKQLSKEELVALTKQIDKLVIAAHPGATVL